MHAAPAIRTGEPRKHVDVLIGGAGPAGVLTGLYLQKAGLSIGFVDPRDDATRWNIVGLSDTARDALAETGIADDLQVRYSENSDTPTLPADQALSAIEQAGRTAAAAAGAQFHFGQAVDGVRNLSGGTGVEVAVRDAATGARALLGADFFINATGGRTGTEAELGMNQITASGSERYVAGWFDYVPGRRSGFEEYGEIRDAATGDVTSSEPLRVFQNPRDGASAFMRVPPDTTDADAVVMDRFVDYAKTPVRAVMPDQRGEMVPMLTGQRGDPMIFAVQHRIAPRARHGNVIGVADTLSRTHPGTYSGASRGAEDARDVGELLPKALRQPERRDALLRELEQRLMSRHAAGVRESLEGYADGMDATHENFPEVAAVIDRWAPLPPA